MLKDIKCPSCNSKSLSFVSINETEHKLRLVCEECNAFCTVYFEFTSIPKPIVDVNELRRRERLDQRLNDITNVLNDLIQVKE